MNSTHEVISAFLDDEPFDPEELAGRAERSGGPDVLIDLVALRRIVQPTDGRAGHRVATPVRRSPWRVAAAAAALFLALGGGYLVGERRAVDRIFRSAAAHSDRRGCPVRPRWRHSMRRS